MSTAAATMNPTDFSSGANVSTSNNLPATQGGNGNSGAMTTTGQGGAGAPGGGGQNYGYGMALSGSPMAQVRQILQQPTVRKALPAIVAMMAVVVLALVYSFMQAPQTRALLPGLQGAALQAAYDSLKQGGFSPEFDEMTGQLQVPQSRIHETRIFVAVQGIP